MNENIKLILISIKSLIIISIICVIINFLFKSDNLFEKDITWGISSGAYMIFTILLFLKSDKKKELERFYNLSAAEQESAIAKKKLDSIRNEELLLKYFVYPLIIIIVALIIIFLIVKLVKFIWYI